MEAYQQRVVIEKDELDIKRANLLAFIGSTRYVDLDPAEQTRMHWQANAMAAYSKVLGLRIAAFSS